MRYDKYVTKMKKMKKAQNFVLKYRVIMLIIAGILLAFSASYLISAGTVTNITMPDDYVYGQKLSVEGNAMFRDVTYEYLVEGESEWTSVEPTMPGNYQVRAVCTKLIGGVSYSSPAPFVIKPKEIEVQVVGGLVEFGDKPKITADLIEGDYFYYADFEYENYGSKKTVASVIEESIVVYNSANEDVTAAYCFVNKSAEISFVSRVINIELPTVEKVYDGNPLTSSDYEIVDSSLLENHEIELTTDASITETGSVQNNVASLNVYYNNINVTENYYVKYIIGDLVVNKRPITFITNSKTKVYDSTYLYDEGFTIKNETTIDEGLVEGHYAKVVSSSKTNVACTIQNVLEIKIYDSENNDVTHNYEISYEYGDLTVDKYEIAVQTEDADKMYDGTPLFNTAWNLIEDATLLEGHNAEVANNYATITELGIIDNVLELVIYDEDGKVVTSNYNIKYTYGKLIINERDLVITTPSAEKEYDAEPLYALDYQIRGLAGGFDLEIVEYPTITELGTIKNELKIAIIDKDGNDVTDRFNPWYEYGTLTIKQKHITIKTNDISKYYDNTPLDGTQIISGIQQYSVVGYELPEEHYLKPIEYSSMTDVGESITNEIVFLVMKGQGEDAKDYSDHYLISYEYGDITINPRPIYIDIVDKDKVYDGTPLTSNDWKYSEDTLYELVDGETLELVNLGTITDVGTVINENGSYTVYRAGVGINSNYAVTVNAGTLEVTIRNVTVNIVDKDKVYDGAPLTSNAWEYSEDTLYELVDGETLELVNLGTITDVGTVINENGSYTVYRAGVGINSNYAVTVNAGTLEVTIRNVTVNIVDKDKVYDGAPLTSNAWEYNEDTLYELVAGETLELVNLGTITDVGTVINENSSYTVYRAGEDINLNYAVTVNAGTLEVTKREITVYPHAEKVYDGKEFTSNLWKYSEDTLYELVDGETLEIITNGSVVNVFDNNANTIISHKVLKGTTDISGNYDVKYKQGQLVIKEREITVYPYAEKVYDGQVFTSNLWKYSEDTLYELVAGETLEIITNGSVINVFDNNANTITSHKVLKGTTDISGNYDVKYKQGQLVVKEREISVYPYAEKVYDGQVFTSNLWKYSEDTLYELVAGETLEIITNGSVINVFDNNANTITSHKVLKGTTDISGNYDVKYKQGQLVVKEREISIIAKYATKVYDGEYLESDEWEHQSGTKFEVVVGEILTLDAIGRILDFGTVDNPIDKSTIKIVKANGEDSILNYIINTSDKGQLEITKRKITVETYSKEQEYNGEYLTYEDALKNGQSFGVTSEEGLQKPNESFVVNDYVDDYLDVILDENGKVVGVENKVILDVYRDGKDISDNYEIEYDYGELVITQRPVKVYPYDEKTYDGKEFTSDDWEYSEDSKNSIVEGEELQITTNGKVIGVLDNNKNVITDHTVIRDGKDISDNYIIEYEEGQLVVNPLEITIYPYDEKVYDGKEFTSNKWKYGEGSLNIADGEELQIVTNGKVINVFDDNKNIIVSHKVLRGKTDVSVNYIVHYEEGQLVVNKREISIIAKYATKAYDGDYLTSNEWEHQTETKYKVVEGETLTLETTGSILDFGKVDNPIDKSTIKIVKANGEDSTLNYIVNTSDKGQLEITKRKITIETYSCEREYNGEILTYEKAVKDGLYYKVISDIDLAKSNERFEIKDYIKDYLDVLLDKDGNVLDKDNKIILDVYRDDKLISDNYDIKYEYGKLKIIKRKITIETYSYEREYNGEILTYEKAVKDGLYYKVISNQDLALASEKLFIVDYLKDYLDVSLDKEGNVLDKYNTIILGVNRDGKDMSSNYDITYQYGKLKINKREITVYPYDEKVYDGKEFTSNKWKYSEDTLFELVKGEVLEVVTNGKVVNVFDPNTNKIISHKVLRGTEDVSSNYKVNYEDGKLVVNKRQISVYPYDEKVYDGQEFTSNKWKYSTDTLYELVEGETLEVVTNGKVINVFDDNVNTIISHKVLKGTTDISENYDVKYKQGQLVVNKREISIIAKYATKAYDGDYLTSNEWEHQTKTKYKVVENEVLTLIATGSILDFGKVDNPIDKSTIKIVKANGEDSTLNYIVNTSDKGQLEITKRKITIETYSYEREYSGEALTYLDAVKDGNNYKIISDLQLAKPNEDLEVIKYLKDYVDVLFDKDGNIIDQINEVVFEVYRDGTTNISQNYDIKYEYGKLKVVKRKITIETYSREREYNGNALTYLEALQDGKYYKVISEQQIVNGEYLEVIKYLKDYLDVLFDKDGNVIDQINMIVFDVYRDDDVISNNYDIKYEYGKLKVCKREITVYPYDERVYNGEEFTSNNWEYSKTTKFELVKGEVLEVTTNGKVVNVFDPNTNKITSHKVLRGTKDISSNYIVNYEDGKLVVLKREISIIAKYATKAYDGDYLTSNEWEHQKDTKYEVVKTEVLTLLTSGSILDFGKVDNPIIVESIKILKADGSDSTLNYDITTSDKGQLEITKRKITIETYSYEREYNGEALTYLEAVKDGNNYKIISDLQLAKPNESLDVVKYLENYIDVLFDEKDNILDQINEVVFEVYRNGTTNISKNYDIKYEYGNLKVVKREITIKTYSYEREYNGEALTYFETYVNGKFYDITSKNSLAKDNESLIVLKYVDDYINVEYDEENNITNRVNYIDFIVSRDFSKDISKNYNINYEYGTLKIVKRKISIITATMTTPYLAEPFSCTDWSYEKNSLKLVSDHKLIPLEGYATITELGSTENIVDYMVENEEIDKNYDLSITYGTLTVVKRVITITSNSAEKGYDRSPLYEPGCIIEGDLILENYHDLLLYNNTYITDVGSIENEFTYEIVSLETFEDVSEYYEVTCYFGTLTVHPYNLFIFTGSAQKEYDGLPLTNSEIYLLPTGNPDFTIIDKYSSFKITDMYEEHIYTVVMETTGYYINPGYYTNGAIIFVYDEDGNDVSEFFYDNGQYYGSLEIFGDGYDPDEDKPSTDDSATNDRMIKIDPGYYTTEYNGQVQMVPQNQYTVTPQQLPNGYHYEKFEVKVVGEGTDIGRYPSYVEYDIVIADKEGNDVTKEFFIQALSGKFEITRIDVTIHTDTFVEPYTGLPIQNGTVSVSGNFLEGHKLNILSELPTITEIGRVRNVVEYEIVDEEGNDVSNFYNVIKDFGYLEVTHRKLTISTNSHTWEYDGFEHYDSSYSLEKSEHTLLEGHKLMVISDPVKMISPGEEKNSLKVIIIDQNGNTVYDENMKNSIYSVIEDFGTLIITCKLYVETESSTKTFDGTELINHNYNYFIEVFISEKNYEKVSQMPTGHMLIVKFKNSILHVSKVKNEVEIKVVNESGKDVTKYYDFKNNVKKGTLEITKLNIQVSVKTQNVYYTGKAITINSKNPLKYSGLSNLKIAYEEIYELEVDNKSINCNTYNDAINIKNYELYGYIGDKLENLSGDVEIKLASGKLVIKQISITITSASEIKEYDGSPLINSEYTLTGNLAEGHQEVVVITGSVYLGTVDNTIESIKIIDAAGNDVTSNYKIKPVEGTLIVV